MQEKLKDVQKNPIHDFSFTRLPNVVPVTSPFGPCNGLSDVGSVLKNVIRKEPILLVPTSCSASLGAQPVKFTLIFSIFYMIAQPPSLADKLPMTTFALSAFPRTPYSCLTQDLLNVLCHNYD